MAYGDTDEVEARAKWVEACNEYKLISEGFPISRPRGIYQAGMNRELLKDAWLRILYRPREDGTWGMSDEQLCTMYGWDLDEYNQVKQRTLNNA